MGLTIHYTLKAEKVSTDEARALVRQLHAAALDLPFDEVSEIVEVLGRSSRSAAKLEVGSDAHRLMAQTGHPVRLMVDGQEAWQLVKPTSLIVFRVDPGQGCDTVTFGLGQFPESVEVGGKQVPTDLEGWRWWGFIKTQYASNPSLGGLKQFLRCHLGVVSLLDAAKEIGILDEVKDEGGYWEKRDISALVKEIGKWNKMVAGLVGQLTDQMEAAGQDRKSMMSAITEFPDFERLEAKGRKGEGEGQEYE